jgi:hypothetical protein
LTKGITREKPPGMKKPNRSAKDPAKPVRALAPVTDQQDLLSTSPSNISRERIMDGAATTTELLNEILQRQKQPEPMRHWGLNE